MKTYAQARAAHERARKGGLATAAIRRAQKEFRKLQREREEERMVAQVERALDTPAYPVDFDILSGFALDAVAANLGFARTGRFEADEQFRERIAQRLKLLSHQR